MAPTDPSARSPLAPAARRFGVRVLLAALFPALLLAAPLLPIAAHAADRRRAEGDAGSTNGAATSAGETHTTGEASPPKLLTPWQLAGLKAALADRSSGTRGAAIRICADKGGGALLDPAQIAPYLEHPLALTSENLDAAETQDAAARVAGKMGERGAVFAAQLVELVKHGAPDTFLTATEALGAIGPRGADFADLLLPLLEAGDLETLSTVAAIDALAGMSASRPALASHIVSLLGRRQGDVKIAVLKAMGLMSRRDVPLAAQILPLLKDNRPETRAAAAEALGEIGEEGVAVAADLSRLLKDPSNTVQIMAADALAKLSKVGGGMDALAARYLTDRDANTRTVAARALGKMGAAGASHAPEIAKLLKDPDENPRASAASALADLGEAGAAYAPEIASLLNDAASIPRIYAINALAKFGERGARYAPEIAKLLASGAVRGDVSGDTNGAEILSATEREAAVWALASFGARGAAYADVIAKVPRNAFFDAAGPLFALGDCRGEERLRALLRDEDAASKETALAMLQKSGKSTAPFASLVAPLISDDSMTSNGATVSADAVKTLAAMGSDVAAAYVDDLLLAFFVRYADAQQAAVDTLLQLAPRRSDLASRLAPLLAMAPNTREMLRLLDEIGLSATEEKEREAFFASALEAIQSNPTSLQPQLRAHLRLWCGSDEVLQRALDWLGAPESLPKVIDLSPTQLRELALLMTRLWNSTLPWHLEVTELAERADTLTAALLTPSDPDPGLAAVIENDLRARIKKHADDDAATLKLSRSAAQAEPPEDTAAGGAKAIAPWQRAGIRAAIRDSSPEVRLATVQILTEKGQSRWLTPEEILPGLRHDDENTRATAAQALGQMGRRGSPLASRLLPMLQDCSSDTTVSSATALGALGAVDAAVGPQVAPMLQDPVGRRRANALQALGGMGPKLCSFSLACSSRPWVS